MLGILISKLNDDIKQRDDLIAELTNERDRSNDALNRLLEDMPCRKKYEQGCGECNILKKAV